MDAEIAKEVYAAHRRVDSVIAKEQERLKALGIASRAEFRLDTASGGEPGAAAKAVRLTLMKRLHRFFTPL